MAFEKVKKKSFKTFAIGSLSAQVANLIFLRTGATSYGSGFTTSCQDAVELRTPSRIRFGIVKDFRPLPLPVFSGRIRGCYTAGITRFYPDPLEVSEDFSLSPARYLLIIHRG